MPGLSRRRFLRKSAELAAFGMVVVRNASSAATEPNHTFPTDPRQRLAVPSWPFRAYIQAPMNRWARDRKLPGMDLKDFAAVVVEKFKVRKDFRSSSISA